MICYSQLAQDELRPPIGLAEINSTQSLSELPKVDCCSPGEKSTKEGEEQKERQFTDLNEMKHLLLHIDKENDADWQWAEEQISTMDQGRGTAPGLPDYIHIKDALLNIDEEMDDDWKWTLEQLSLYENAESAAASASDDAEVAHSCVAIADLEVQCSQKQRQDLSKEAQLQKMKPPRVNDKVVLMCGLPCSCKTQDLVDALEDWRGKCGLPEGSIRFVKIPVDRKNSKKNTVGFAFVAFDKAETAHMS